MTGLFAFNVIALWVFNYVWSSNGLANILMKGFIVILLLCNLAALANELDIITLNLNPPIEAVEILE